MAGAHTVASAPDRRPLARLGYVSRWLVAFVARRQWFAIAIGLIAIGVGIGQFVEAYNATFKKDLKRTEMKRWEKDLVDNPGRMGLLSRGVTFSIVGWFVLQGGLHQDASQVHGYPGAFVFLLQQPYGHILLAAVALGLIALGLHSFACARWIRLLSEER